MWARLQQNGESKCSHLFYSKIPIWANLGIWKNVFCIPKVTTPSFARSIMKTFRTRILLSKMLKDFFKKFCYYIILMTVTCLTVWYKMCRIRVVFHLEWYFNNLSILFLKGALFWIWILCRLKYMFQLTYKWLNSPISQVGLTFWARNTTSATCRSSKWRTSLGLSLVDKLRSVERTSCYISCLATYWSPVLHVRCNEKNTSVCIIFIICLQISKQCYGRVSTNMQFIHSDQIRWHEASYYLCV